MVDQLVFAASYREDSSIAMTEATMGRTMTCRYKFVPIGTVIPGAAPSGTPAMPNISTFTLPLPGKALGTLNACSVLVVVCEEYIQKLDKLLTLLQ